MVPVPGDQVTFNCPICHRLNQIGSNPVPGAALAACGMAAAAGVRRAQRRARGSRANMLGNLGEPLGRAKLGMGQSLVSMTCLIHISKKYPIISSEIPLNLLVRSRE